MKQIQYFLLVMFLAVAASNGSSSDEITTAIDARGVLHTANAYKGKAPAWFDDRLKIVAPNYSPFDRASYHEGTGVFHLVLDLNTGFVTKVTVRTTTGFHSVDACAVAALRQWTWRPGKWKEIELPLTFKIRS
jgi:hypothetical protein